MYFSFRRIALTVPLLHSLLRLVGIPFSFSCLAITCAPLPAKHSAKMNFTTVAFFFVDHHQTSFVFCTREADKPQCMVPFWNLFSMDHFSFSERETDSLSARLLKNREQKLALHVSGVDIFFLFQNR